MRLLIAIVFGCVSFLLQNVHAASAYAGFYVGTIYIRISGSVSIPEYSAGGVAITIDQNGILTSSGDLSGAVDNSGNVTFNTPNSAGFTTGHIDNIGTLSASASQDQGNGVTTTWRIDAKNAPPGFGASASLAGRITQLNPSKTLKNMRSLRYAANKFMTVGQKGSVAFSDDGLTWNRFGLQTTVTLYGIAASPSGTYVVVGDSGARFYSVNGVDWVARSGTVGPYTSVAYGNGTFVAVDFLGKLYTSPDGNVWSAGAQPLGGGSFYTKIDFLNGRFVAYGGSAISFSPDAVTWSAPAQVSVGPFNIAFGGETKLAFENGTYVAGGDSGLAYSTDGNTWTKVTAPAGRIQMVASANGTFFAQDTPNDFWVSTNGIAWKRVFNMLDDLYAVAYGAGRFIAQGGELYTSTDGSYWVQPETDTMRHTYLQQAFYDMRPGVVEHAITEEGFYGQGVAGRPETGPIGPAPVRHYFSLSNFGQFWVGDNGYIYYHNNTFTTNYGVVPKLTDSTFRTSVGDSQSAMVIAGDSGAMVRVPLVGGNAPLRFELLRPVTGADLLSGTKLYPVHVLVGTGGTIVAATNVTLTNWTTVSSGGTDTLRHVSSYTRDAGSPSDIMIAVGDNGAIVTSPNGISWTRRNSGTRVRLLGASLQSFGTGKRFIAAGEDGTLVESTNAVDWKVTTRLPAPHPLVRFEANNAFGKYGLRVVEAQSSSPFDGLFTMRYTTRGSGRVSSAALGNGRWVVVGDRFTGISFDGSQWTSKIVPVAFEAVAFGEGRFVAAGPSGILGYSFDGLNWTIRTNGIKGFHAVAYGSGRFAAAGAGGLIMISDDGINWTDKTTGSEEFFALTHEAGSFVGAGKGGIIVYSNDNGETWKTANAFTGDTYGIAFGKGRYVLGGSDGWTAYSENGSTWTRKQLPLPSSVESRPRFRRTVFASGTFYSTTEEGELYTSTNGVDFVRLNTGTAQRLDAVVAGNGRILMGGEQIFSLAIENSGAPFFTQQPISSSISAGANVTLTAQLGGLAPLDLQWIKNGQAIPNATNSTLLLTSVTLADAGEYRLSAGNSAGTAISAPAILTVQAPPEIVVQPVSVTVTRGTGAALSVSAGGPGTLSYQWRKNGQAIADGNGISGATSKVLAFGNPQITDSGDYDVIVSNAFGSSTSAVAKFTVEPPPTAPIITAQPVGTNVNVGGTIRLQVAATGGNLTYVWARNDAGIPADPRIVATNGSLTITNAKGSDSGAYQVTVINNLGFAQSAKVQVGVLGDIGFRYDYSINAGGSIYDIQPDGTGNFYIAGTPTLANPFRQYLAKIDSNLQPTNSYVGNGANNAVLSVAPLPDGSVIVAGQFFQWGGNSSRAYIVKLNPTGGIDTAFTSSAGMIVRKVLALPDGKLLIARTGLGFAQSYVNRLNSDGTIDSSFTPITHANRELNSIARQSNGTIWAAGLFGVKKANADGTGVTDISADASARVIVGPDDKVYVNNNNGNSFTRRNADGSADATFAVTIDGVVNGIAFLSGGKMVIVGNFRNVNGKASSKIAILQSNGQLDASFQSPYTSETGDLRAIRDLGDGTVLVGGDVQLASPNQRYLQRIQISISTPSTGQSFSDWKNAYNFTTGVNDAPGQDADNDGLSNAAEFGLGTNPLVSGAGQRPASKYVAANGQTYAGLQFTRNKNATGVEIQVTASNSVAANSNETVIQSVEDLGNGLERVTVRAAQPLLQIPKLFFSVKVRTL